MIGSNDNYSDWVYSVGWGGYTKYGGREEGGENVGEEVVLGRGGEIGGRRCKEKGKCMRGIKGLVNF